MGRSYSSKYYDAAEAEYQKALAEYTGENGLKKVITAGNQYGTVMGEAQGNTAANQARANARNAGLSRGASAIAGQQAANSAIESGYNTGFQTAANLANQQNQAYLQGKQNQVGWAQSKDEYINNQKNNNMSGVMQGVGTAAAIGAAMLSDENCKEISTDDELRKKLEETKNWKDLQKSTERKIEFKRPEPELKPTRDKAKGFELRDTVPIAGVRG
jgi:hypothetical protein